MPTQSSRDLANAKEWLEDMGFVIDEEETPQANFESIRQKPAA